MFFSHNNQLKITHKHEMTISSLRLNCGRKKIGEVLGYQKSSMESDTKIKIYLLKYEYARQQ